ncbi:hypothetical protein ES703_83891 [subsurface metagenome]
MSGIESVKIELRGFTLEELKDIIVYLRSVEDHRASRFIHVMMDTPDLNPIEAERLIHELWPDAEGPRFTVHMQKLDRTNKKRW